MQTAFINNLFLRVSAWPLAQDRPTLVCVHGAGGTSVLWHNQIDAFGDVANVVAVDLPGHGDSPGNVLETIPEYAQVVAELVTSIQAPDPVACGLSLGGGIALQLLLDYGTSFRAGVLIGTGAKLRVMPLIFDTIENNFDAFIQSMPLMAASPKTDRAVLEPLLEAAAANGASVAATDFRACDHFDVMARLGEIDLPVLVLSAQDDQLTPPKYGAFLAEGISKAQRVEVSAAGHLAPVEQPEVVNESIRGFVRGL